MFTTENGKVVTDKMIADWEVSAFDLFWLYLKNKEFFEKLVEDYFFLPKPKKKPSNCIS